jgi:hypothetical protein
MSSVAINVFAKGPGDSLTDREKMSTMASSRYWPSYMDHGCVRNERSVSAGEKLVSSEVMEDVGDWRLRMRERVARHFLRTRCGIRVGRADRPGTFVRAILVVWSSRKAR